MKVVITDYQYENIVTERSIIEGAGHQLYDYQAKTSEEVIPLVKDADAVITQYSEISREVIEQMQHCKVVIKYGIGVNNIDCDAATEKGIYICNVPDYGVEEVSDHAIAMLLALGKKLPTLTAALKDGDWGYQSVVPLFRLSECTVGLIGFGRIPQLVAKKLSGWGMNILAFDPWVDPQIAAHMGVTLTDMDTLLRKCDFISVHCPLTKDTKGLIGADSLEKMKPTAFVINTARGGVIDEEALVEALKTGKVAGAGIDVFENEPISQDSPLLHMKEVIATPHSAWYSETAIQTLQRKVAEEVVNILGGGVPFNCVNQKKIAGKR